MKFDPITLLKQMYGPEKVTELRANTDQRMSRKERVRITRVYVRHAHSEYVQKYDSPHPPAEVMSHVAEALAAHFPSMRDAGTPADKPTYVSPIYSDLRPWCLLGDNHGNCSEIQCELVFICVYHAAIHVTILLQPIGFTLS